MWYVVAGEVVHERDEILAIAKSFCAQGKMSCAVNMGLKVINSLYVSTLFANPFLLTLFHNKGPLWIAAR